MTAAAQEYGGALYALAVEHRCEDALLESLSAASRLLDESPRYVGMLENPALPKNERLALLDEAFGAGVHPFVLNFMKILCEKREMGVLHGAAADFRARWDEAHGRLGAVAQSAVPLTKAQQDKLAAKLSELTHKQVYVRYEVDPALGGGVRVKVAGKELDGTVKSRLEALRRALTE